MLIAARGESDVIPGECIAALRLKVPPLLRKFTPVLLWVKALRDTVCPTATKASRPVVVLLLMAFEVAVTPNVLVETPV
ncbi:MAG TPA: hypothetical protein VES60_04645, partial [Nakamurella sp.]|nr:hypothetical protein [Nakamurella sp.]